MSSLDVLSLAIVRAAGELDVMVCLLLFKHQELPKKKKKYIHIYIHENKTAACSGHGRKLRVGAVNIAHRPKKKNIFMLEMLLQMMTFVVEKT